MRSGTWLVAVALCFGVAWGQDDRARQFSGNGFVFGFEEPQGWTLKMNSALESQLSNFVLYKNGYSWRDAESVIYLRLSPREKNQKLEEYVDANVESFKQYCPLFEIKDISMKSTLDRPFLTKRYECPQSRPEVIAISETGDWFVLLVLSARRSEQLEKAMPDFEKVVSSFYWKDRPKRRMIIPNLQRPQQPPRS